MQGSKRIVIVGTALTFFAVVLGDLIFFDEGYYTNIFTELLSLVVTVFVLNVYFSEREEARRLRDFVYDAGSASNHIAIRAAEYLYRHGKLFGDNSLLRNADLRGANLRSARLNSVNLCYTNLDGANLARAQLERTNFSDANLSHTNLRRADLSYATLMDAHFFDTQLQGASLVYTKMQRAVLDNANLRGANLHGADLTQANLVGTNLTGANLTGCTLTGAEFDDRTRLPDGSHWRPDVDMQQFGCDMEPPPITGGDARQTFESR